MLMAKKKWNIRSIFFEEEPTQKSPGKSPAAKQPKTKASPAPPSSSSAPAAPPVSPPAEGPVTGGVSDRFVKVLMAAMEEVNLPGFDYLEYNVTPTQLIDSAQHYLNTLEKEQQKFATALSGQRAQQVSSKQDQLKQLDASIAQQEAKIKELQAQIKKTRSRQEKLQQDIGQSNAKLAQTQADFETTYNVLINGVQQDVERMKQYLK